MIPNVLQFQKSFLIYGYPFYMKRFTIIIDLMQKMMDNMPVPGALTIVPNSFTTELFYLKLSSMNQTF